MRGDSGVAGEGRVVGAPKFHSWGKCTMPLTGFICIKSSSWAISHCQRHYTKQTAGRRSVNTGAMCFTNTYVGPIKFQ